MEVVGHGVAESWARPLWDSARARERRSKRFGFTPGGREGLQWALLAIAFLPVLMTGPADNRYEWMGHSCTRRMESEGELRRGHAEAATNTVTCHGGTGRAECWARPGIVRMHVLQRVLRVDIGSIGWTASVVRTVHGGHTGGDDDHGADGEHDLGEEDDINATR